MMSAATQRISSIPINPRSKGHRHGQQDDTPGSRYGDLQHERFAMDDVQHPEDHLEDLVSLPIAKELTSKRSKTSLASWSNASSSNIHTSLEPPVSAAVFPVVSQNDPHSSTSDHRVESNQASASPSTPPPVTGPTKTPSPVVSPPKRSDSLRKRAKSTPLQPSSSRTRSANNPSSPEMLRDTSSSSTSSNSERAKKVRGESPNTIVHQQEPLTPRSRGGNGKTNQPKSSPRNAPSPGTSVSAPRRALKSTPASDMARQSSTNRKKISTPSPSTPKRNDVRQRANSASLLSTPPSSYTYDSEAKPPWLDENPTYLYKSDLTAAAAPGSLADLAYQAQQRNGASPIARSSPEQHPGDKSWDDVILPAVAKQIRARQAAALQGVGSSPGSSQITDESELLITEWNTDGTPRKWKRVGQKQQDRLLLTDDEAPQETLQAENAVEGSVDRLAGEKPDFTVYISQTSPQVHGPVGQPPAHTPPFSNTQLVAPAHSSPANRSTASLAAASNSTSQAHRSTGRTERWDEPGLTSPNVAMSNGFSGQQADAARRMQNEKGEKAQPAKDESTHKGGCRCIIM